MVVAVGQPTLEFVPDEVPEPVETDDPWTLGLSIGSSVNVASSNNVIGQQNGSTVTVSFNLRGNADFAMNRHEWRSNLSLTESITRTPSLDRFVKGTDILSLDTTYYFLASTSPPIGPFARATLDTALFAGVDVRGDDNFYEIARVDGSVETRGPSRTLRLTDSFQPLLLKQSLGAFARPITETEIEMVIRLGFGFRETFANGALAVDDDEDTEDVIEVKELQSYQQAGSEAALEFRGSFEEGRIRYVAKAEMMTPFFDTLSDDETNAFEQTNYDLGFSVGFRLTTWASLDYELTARRTPRLIDDWQVTNSVLITFSYQFFE